MSFEQPTDPTSHATHEPAAEAAPSSRITPYPYQRGAVAEMARHVAEGGAA